MHGWIYVPSTYVPHSEQTTNPQPMNNETSISMLIVLVIIWVILNIIDKIIDKIERRILDDKNKRR